MNNEIDKILEPGEKVLWEGSPKFWPFFLGRSLPLIVFLAFLAGFVKLITVMAHLPAAFTRHILFAPQLWIGFAVLALPALYSILVFKRIAYAVTSKRVVIQAGLIARGFQTVDFDKITNAQVSVGIFDKLLEQGTGSIFISTAGTFVATRQGMVPRPYALSNIQNPYEVYKFFEKVEYDVKTDIEYPNKLRPEDNPGYKTKYDPDQK